MADVWCDNGWHTGGAPRRKVSGTLSANYSGLTISASFSGNQVLTASGFSSMSDTARLYIDGNQVGSTTVAMTGGGISMSGSLNVGAGNHTISVTMECPDVTNGRHCSASLRGPITIGSLTLYVPDPYSPPSYDIWSATQIVKVDRDKVDVNYKIDGGTNGLDWVIARVDGVKDFNASKNKGGSLWTSFYPTWGDGFRHGSSYNVRIRFSDNHAEYQTGHKTFYTYQEPKLTGVSVSPSSANAQNQSITFTQSGINDRAWSTLEQKFYTLAHCTAGGSNVGNGWTQVGTVGNNASFTLNGASLRGFVPKAYDNQTVTMHVKRRNSSANWESAEQTCTFKVIYRPQKGVTCANTSYKKNNSFGAAVGKGALVINDNTTTGIHISWNYDTTTSDAGYTQGYRIRLYNTSKVVVKTYYTSSKNYTIPKADIPKMQNTYIDITPYFANDQSSVASSAVAGNYWYFANPVKCDFVVLATKLSKPTITYPVEGSEWINTKFRVCFQLPSDGDKGAELETYHYEDIEVSVNGKVFRMTSNPEGLTSGGVQAAGAFSSTASNLTYTKKIVVAPFKASNFPTASTYQIRVRVKKKYTTVKNNWSPWSDVRTFRVKTATFTPAVGDIIYASHYNDSKKVIDRVRKTYSVAWNTKPSDVARGTEILRTQYPYTNLYSIIVDTKKKVNNYATFDSSQTSVKFDSTNAIQENFTQYVELVTAASNESKSDASGRNYMRIVYDRCNKLI
jgi:hypothetical protein